MHEALIEADFANEPSRMMRNNSRTKRRRQTFPFAVTQISLIVHQSSMKYARTVLHLLEERHWWVWEAPGLLRVSSI